ncbi:SLC27A1_4 [Lepeophtheirus salmonis]|uniref:long-chain-fatty-acid--CoA ligase n=1 Tax=Lepeophtheirus salmonis TaxID=72036 RepID=A0A7R8CGT2_LEPSM|nr:SLC27A1_4 [Lepeophtheirus salmonis]CAF2773119.1 SLC27A1_4 [Lepeophtheirus salmonis]
MLSRKFIFDLVAFARWPKKSPKTFFYSSTSPNHSFLSLSLGPPDLLNSYRGSLFYLNRNDIISVRNMLSFIGSIHCYETSGKGAYRYISLLLLMKYYELKDVSVPVVFSRTVKKHGDSPAIFFEDVVWTFLDLESYSNRVARYLISQGFVPGDCVALYMENRPEYVGIWLGCAKAGIVPALINTHIVGNPLRHSIDVASASAVIYGVELSKPINEIKSLLPNIKYYESGSTTTSPEYSEISVHHGSTSDHHDQQHSAQQLSFTDDKLLHNPNCDLTSKYFDTEIKKFSTESVPPPILDKSSNFRSKLLFYYFAAGSYYLNNMGNIKDLCLYNPLPLYHSAGGLVGIGIMMVFGVRIAIRRKFSVRNFWKDCIKYNCTGAQYIGEICRYLLSSPETPEDKSHNIQLLFGNGLRPTIWNQFTERFGVTRIAEFYGSTEGNANLMNIDCKPGAVGFASRLFPSVYPVRLVRLREDGNVLRDPRTGLCVLCKPGETGEFVGKIIKNHVMRDSWFRSGDLLNMDECGWMYFIDRIGDTFRWRGENVSTIEVEAVLSNVLQQRDNIVYGVEVPGAEGRAGMAAIVGDELDLGGFLAAIKNQLPAYARPLFLRLVKSLDITGTFKLKKRCLQNEGYNPHVIQDPLYFLDTVKGVYRKLDAILYNDIMEMRCRI